MSVKVNGKAVLISVLVILACSGCQSVDVSKAAIRANWEQTVVKNNLPLAKQYFDLGRYDDAEKLTDEILQIRPELAEMHLLKGRLLLVKHDMVRGKQEIVRAIELDGKLHQAWYCLGLLAEKAQEQSQALKCYRKALALMPQNADYVLAIAEMYIGQDRLDTAMKLLEEKMRQMPDDILLKMAAADLMVQKDKTNRAVELLRKALLLDDSNAEIMESLGYCYLLERRWEKAADIFEKLSETCPAEQRKRYLQLLSMCSMKSGEYEKATEIYDELSIDERRNAKIWLLMGQAALGAGSPNRALYCGNKALTLKPGWTDAIALNGCARYVKKNYYSAIKTFSRIKDDRDNGGLAWMMMGKCYEQLGYKEKAAQAYESAREFEPESELLALLESKSK